LRLCFYKENEGDTFVPPFELYKTSVSYSASNSKCIYIDTIGIKSNIKHANHIQELLIQAHQNINKLQPSKFVLAGISATIGADTYISMICNNNQYLANIATILVIGITKTMLDFHIKVYDLLFKTKYKKLRAILTNKPWCQLIETTKVDARILMITSKAQLIEGHKWQDANLPILHAQFLKPNPKFILDIDNPILK